jgi:hypothetical protein
MNQAYCTTVTSTVTEEPSTPTVMDSPPTLTGRAIDALPGNRAQCIAAALVMCLTRFDGTRHLRIMEPTRLKSAQIAAKAGYPKAAVWRALPVIAAAGLIRWRKLDGMSVEITWLMVDEGEVSA